MGAVTATAASPQAPSTGFDAGVFDFWSSKVRTPYNDFVNHQQSQGVQAPAPQDSTFLFASASKGLTLATVLTADDIPDLPDSGDVSVSVKVDRFRPSKADQAALASLQTGTLRIDVKQVDPLPGLPEALAWTAMATLAAKKGKQVPTLNNVTFDPGSIWGKFQTIPLTSGIGFWSWNFFMKKREGFWAQLLDHLFATIKDVQPLLPLLGLPGIAVSGLKYIDDILGGIQAEGDSAWMFRGLDIAVCGTKESLKRAGTTGTVKLPLTFGNYVVFPQDKVTLVDPGLVVQAGYLVPPKTPANKTFDAAAQLFPDVSYMTMTVSVTSGAKKPTSSTGEKKTGS
jgi:hypothetical protein